MGSLGDRLKAKLAEQDQEFREQQQLKQQESEARQKRLLKARGIASNLRPKVFEPFLDEFCEAMDKAKVLINSRPQQSAEGENTFLCVCPSFGTAPGQPLFDIRISATANNDESVTLMVECLYASPAERSAPPKEKIFESKPWKLPLVSYSEQSVRDWCGDQLEKCAMACQEKNRSR